MFYRFIFLLTLAPAIYIAYRRGGDFVTVATVIIGSWAISFVSFEGSDPIWSNAVADALCAAFIASLCHDRAALNVGVLFGVSCLISITYGVYLSPEKQYNHLYAHALSTMGHLQNLALLLGAADDGIRNRIRAFIRAMGRTVPGFGFHHRDFDFEDRRRKAEVVKRD